MKGSVPSGWLSSHTLHGAQLEQIVFPYMCNYSQVCLNIKISGTLLKS